MAHFYGVVQGQRGEATRCGTPASGLSTTCASWKGAVKCTAYIRNGIDCVSVEKTPWQGQGESKVLYDGPIGESKS